MTDLTLEDIYTYSIDLTIEWTNRSVRLNRIEKDKPARVYNYENLWLAPDNKSFYSYNGGLTLYSEGFGDRPNELWRFRPSGNSGTWSVVGTTAAGAANFTNLICTYGSTSAFGNGTGYSLGGVRFGSPTPGLVAYDMHTGSWSNTTDGNFPMSTPFSFGQLKYLAQYGAEGILIALGGRTSNAAGQRVSETIIGFDSLSIYDIASRTWHTQTTNGEIPPGRYGFCAVNVTGDDNTTEVRASYYIK